METAIDATAARLAALEATLFAFKGDVQYRQQPRMRRAAVPRRSPRARPPLQGPTRLLGAALWAREARAAWVPMRGSSMADAAWPAPRCCLKTPMEDADAAVVGMQAAAAGDCGAAVHARGHAVGRGGLLHGAGQPEAEPEP